MHVVHIDKYLSAYKLFHVDQNAIQHLLEHYDTIGVTGYPFSLTLPENEYVEHTNFHAGYS